MTLADFVQAALWVALAVVALGGLEGIIRFCIAARRTDSKFKPHEKRESGKP